VRLRTIGRIAACVATVIFTMGAAHAQQFKAGFGKRDITPKKPVPMWGYGARHDALSTGVLDPLYAKAVVLDFGVDKLAIVGLDLGRSPGGASLQRIRDEVKAKANVNYMMLVGSHTHHGPVLELKNEDGKGKGKFDDAVAYVKEMEDGIIAAIVDAAGGAVEAKIGWGSMHVDMNRNRQSKWEPKSRDTELSVIRIDDNSGKTVALLVNYTAHPTSIPAQDLRFSADYPGKMMDFVEAQRGTNCVFLQGAAGDMSCKRTESTNTIENFGTALGWDVLRVADSISAAAPASPSLKVKDEDFSFATRLDFAAPQIKTMFSAAFFPELANASIDDLADNKIEPHLTTTVINNELALAGVSGELFSRHAVRLKERARDTKTLLLGYCNGHHMYFPTAEAVAEGGYGADEQVSWVEIGGPEKMMHKALVNIYEMLGKKQN
jgi:neutral ceramidase